MRQPTAAVRVQLRTPRQAILCTTPAADRVSRHAAAQALLPRPATHRASPSVLFPCPLRPFLLSSPPLPTPVLSCSSPTLLPHNTEAPSQARSRAAQCPSPIGGSSDRRSSTCPWLLAIRCYGAHSAHAAVTGTKAAHLLLPGRVQRPEAVRQRWRSGLSVQVPPLGSERFVWWAASILEQLPLH